MLPTLSGSPVIVKEDPLKLAVIAPVFMLTAGCASTAVREPRLALAAEPVTVDAPRPSESTLDPRTAGLASALAPLELAPTLSSMRLQEVPPKNERVWTINFLLGGRAYDDENFWRPLEDQPAFMIDVTSYKPEAPVGFEFGLGASADNGTDGGVDIESVTSEIYGGVRKTWGPLEGKLHPYIGGGLTAIRVDLDEDIVDDADDSLGGYVHGGIYYSFRGVFNLGVDYRIVRGTDISLFGVGGDADYGQLSLILGFNL